MAFGALAAEELVTLLSAGMLRARIALHRCCSSGADRESSQSQNSQEFPACAFTILAISCLILFCTRCTLGLLRSTREIPELIETVPDAGQFAKGALEWPPSEEFERLALEAARRNGYTRD